MRLGFKPQEYANRSKSNGWATSKFKPVPEGIYDLECIEVKAVVSKAGDKMLKAEFEILDPPTSDAGHIWDYYLLECAANPDALEISRERLAHWAEAAGLPDLVDSDQLEHTQVRVKLVIEPGRGDYGPSNKIKFFVMDGRKDREAEPEATKPVKSVTPVKSTKLDDDIPF